MLWRFISYSQELPLNKKTLNKLFRESIKENARNSNQPSLKHEWIICCTDSSILTSDTLKLYNNKYAYFESNCCNSLTWIFYRKHSFRKYKNFYCQEPPISSIDATDHFFDIKLKTINGDLHLMVSKPAGLTYDFVVVSIEYYKSEKNGKYVVISMVNAQRGNNTLMSHQNSN